MPRLMLYFDADCRVCRYYATLDAATPRDIDAYA